MNKSKLDEILTEVKVQISSAPDYARGDIFAEVLTDIWGDDIGKALGVLNLAKNNVMYYATSSEGYVEKEYLTRELHEWLYKCVLDTGVSTKEALSLAVEVFEVTLDHLNEARKSIHAKGRMKEVVKVFDDHEVQKGMFKQGVVTRRELQGHKTPTGQLARLHQGVKLFHTLKALESRVTGTEGELKDTKAVMSIVAEEVEILNKLNSTGLSKERKIALCKESGLTQKETATKLDISVSTVKRGWNNE